MSCDSGNVSAGRRGGRRQRALSMADTNLYRRRRCNTIGLLIGLVLVCSMALAQKPAPPEQKRPANAFFALCIGANDAKRRTPDQQAKMLKELGYDGMGHLWLGGVAERLKALDARGLKLFQIYMRVSIDPKKRKYDPRLKEVLKLLKGRPTQLALLVGGMKPSAQAGDARGVEIIREIADLARPFGVRVALYPHAGDWLERVEDAVRVANKVDRKNAGVMFNLCHWLKVDDEKNLHRVLKLAMPKLFAVTINGADSGLGRRGGGGRLIQPLGSGSFDVGGVLRTLKKLGYTGPIGLQCFGLKGDAREHLKQSMAAWRKLTAALP